MSIDPNDPEARLRADQAEAAGTLIDLIAPSERQQALLLLARIVASATQLESLRIVEETRKCSPSTTPQPE